MTEIPVMSVGWLENEGYQDGGCYALFLRNGHLFAEMARKGRHQPTYDRAYRLAALWNTDRARRMRS
jgi:hypothetical protein